MLRGIGNGRVLTDRMPATHRVPTEYRQGTVLTKLLTGHWQSSCRVLTEYCHDTDRVLKVYWQGTGDRAYLQGTESQVQEMIGYLLIDRMLAGYRQIMTGRALTRY